jgi:alpha-D-ribose 1-methylphosphonate 5-phosphate C-P lyase
MSRRCYGPRQDSTCGVWYCPLDPTKEPLEDQSWDECCEDCQALRDWHDELVADCARDVA